MDHPPPPATRAEPIQPGTVAAAAAGVAAYTLSAFVWAAVFVSSPSGGSVLLVSLLFGAVHVLLGYRATRPWSFRCSSSRWQPRR